MPTSSISSLVLSLLTRLAAVLILTSCDTLTFVLRSNSAPRGAACFPVHILQLESNRWASCCDVVSRLPIIEDRTSMGLLAVVRWWPTYVKNQTIDYKEKEVKGRDNIVGIPIKIHEKDYVDANSNMLLQHFRCCFENTGHIGEHIAQSAQFVQVSSQYTENTALLSWFWYHLVSFSIKCNATYRYTSCVMLWVS